MALTAAERETVITWSDEDERISVQTCQRKVVTQLLANPSAEIVEDKTFEGTRFVTALLPLGGITIRKAAKGTIRRTPSKTVKRGRPQNVQLCGATKADGGKCGSIASKETGRCPRHANA
jgi:hypothetical protein